MRSLPTCPHFYRIPVRSSDENRTTTQNTSRGIKHVSDEQKKRDTRPSVIYRSTTDHAETCARAASAGRLVLAENRVFYATGLNSTLVKYAAATPLWCSSLILFSGNAMRKVCSLFADDDWNLILNPSYGTMTLSLPVVWCSPLSLQWSAMMRMAVDGVTLTRRCRRAGWGGSSGAGNDEEHRPPQSLRRVTG